MFSQYSSFINVVPYVCIEMEEGTDDDTNIYSCFPELLEENFMMSNPETVYHYMTYKSTNIDTRV